MVFIEVGLGGIGLGSISHHTLHSYTAKCALFWFGIYCCNDIMKLYKVTLYFLSFHIFCYNNVMSNGGGDGHSTTWDGEGVTSINCLLQLGIIWQVEYKKYVPILVVVRRTMRTKGKEKNRRNRGGSECHSKFSLNRGERKH